MKLVIVLAAIVSVGAATLLLSTRQPAAETGPIQVSEARTGTHRAAPRPRHALDGRIEALASEVEALRLVQAALGDDLETLARLASDDDGELEPVEPPSGAELAAVQATALEARLVEEPVDHEWASEAEGEIASAFTREAFAGGALESARCRSTMCRVAVRFDDEDARLSITENLPLEPPFDTDGFIHVEGDGDLEVEIYVARDGHALLWQ